ncbi:hypothetical protein SCLCIDRAFT_10805 [Scleroderma citrinum Foug A]|uniref:Uncharacterized protein n=1 Tax=Scleroderma citrinum Foug A TaxID=1036808 RepID=A0A0C3D5X2_9AGAM|nr:hypothetical protein SCLCIDRAFT_10805 [Scleroderma citrinum Foug A]
MICLHLSLQLTLDLPQSSLILPSYAIQDLATHEFMIYMTIYDSALGYPFFHQISGDRFYWFANPITQEFLCHAFAIPSPAGSLGVIEVITLPDSSVVTGPLVVFGLEKFTFVLAWAIVKFQDIALQRFDFTCLTLNHIAYCINELTRYFNSILEMTNPAIETTDAHEAKEAFLQWLEVSEVARRLEPPHSTQLCNFCEMNQKTQQFKYYKSILPNAYYMAASPPLVPDAHGGKETEDTKNEIVMPEIELSERQKLVLETNKHFFVDALQSKRVFLVGLANAEKKCGELEKVLCPLLGDAEIRRLVQAHCNTERMDSMKMRYMNAVTGMKLKKFC